jgi:tetratricopeptide (TPR) repeat protein
MSRNRIGIPAAVALAVVTLIAVWRIVTLAFADYFAPHEPETALEFRSNHPLALLGLADRSLEQHDFDGAAQFAMQLLAADPLDGRGYRVLADVAMGKGDRDRQRTLIDLAVKHAPRDLPARAWAAQIALSRGDAATGIAHYDRLLRMAPEAQGDVFPVLVSLASAPVGRNALVAELVQKPLWRSAWLAQYAGTAPTASELAPLFRELRKRGGLTADENASYLGRFVHDKQWDQAFLAWADELSPAQLAALSAPTDGGFEDAAPTGSPFEWSIGRVVGVEAGAVPEPDRKGRALRVEFQGRRSAFRDVRQLLLLPPGREYQLNWSSQLLNLETARGLHWTITCADGSGGQILATPPASGTSAWKHYAASFVVPADCPAQWLVLELDARIAAETLAMGTAWFDDVRVVASPETPLEPSEPAVVQ